MSIGATQATGTESSAGWSADPPPRKDWLAQFMGWGSLGLGIPQTFMPGAFDRLIGVQDDARSRAWTRVVGLREHLHAAGILVIGRPRPVGWLWTRVAGDAMDITLLGIALTSKPRDRTRVLGALACVLGITASDVTAAVRMSRDPRRIVSRDPTEARAIITVRGSREDAYRMWHDFQNLPRFMAYVESVQAADGRSHWKASGPGGRTFEWDAQIVEDRPNELISWRSVDGADVQNAGTVRFMPAPGGRGTEIRLDMHYQPPGGAVGATFAQLMGEEPEQMANDDLRRFKQVMETGVVVRSEGSPEGPLTRRLLRQRPAQPLGQKGGR